MAEFRIGSTGGVVGNRFRREQDQAGRFLVPGAQNECNTRSGFQIYRELRGCRRTVSSPCRGLVGPDGTFLRTRCLQLPFCQRRCPPEEFLVATESGRGLFTRFGLRSIEYFASCYGRRLRAARRPNPCDRTL